VRKDRAAAIAHRACGDNFGCPACAGVPDPTLLATCDAGQCKLIDLQTHPSTACKDSTQCRLRTNQCCECGGPVDYEHLIAVSGNYAELVCGPLEDCAECAPEPPRDAEAVCVDGHCQAVWYFED
jgi:hypothetical protein